MMRMDFRTRVIDVKGAFLKGKLDTKNEVLMLEVLQGFHWIYDRLGNEMESRRDAGNAMTKSETVDRAKEIFKEWLEKDMGEKVRIMKAQCNPRVGSSKVYLQMKRTIYGSVQAARAFLIELQKAFKAMCYKRSEADLCLYFKWDEKNELCIWLTWIDDCIVISTEDVVARESAKLMSLFECKDVRLLVEYIGTKVDMKNGK
jgi:Reverse transcriptase (RNA-dependent DNA polymerase)